MRLLLVLFLLLFSANVVTAQKQDHYSRAKIYFDGNGHNIRSLSGLGVAVDHGEHKRNAWFVSDFSATEIEKIRKSGFKVEIVIDDVAQYYRDQNKKKAQKTTSTTSCNTPPVADPSHFHLGTYGGYFTYTEMLQILDSMQLLYPGLISLRQNIDTFHSIEGRPIYWLRISNNPGVDQPTKPQMLVTSLHHAREPGSISSNIYYLWYLLEHYASDAHIKAIIDNTELYFIPCINPDGYIYNITSSPGGGGLWRKNRRDNLDGTFGIDLNRNYGFEFAYDDIGSSPSTSSDTYRGPFAFSEPETQAVKWFAEQHNFKLNLNYHTFNNDLIYPWGYVASLQTIDSNLFFADGSYLTQANHYRYGTCDQTLGYITNGGSDDWMYGDVTTKNKIFAMTPEIGANEFGFYTPITNIIPDCRNNLLANVNAASLLLPFAVSHSTDEKILFPSSGYLHYNLQRLGFPDAATFSVSMISLDPWLTISSAPKTYPGLTLLQQVNDSLSYSLALTTPNGQLCHYVLRVNNGFYNLDDTVSFYYGKEHAVTDPSTTTLTDWTSSGWALTTSSFYSAPTSVKSVPGGIGNYPDNSDLTLDLSGYADLSHATEAYLRFYAHWAIESNYDYVMVSASVGSTGIWQPLCGKYTRPGSTYQAHNEPIYDGQQPTWVQEQMDLHDYLGSQLKIRFELISDAAGNYDGFYVDDVEIRTVQDTPLSAINVATANLVLTAHPNPASNELTLSTTGLTTLHSLNATLYDCIGREAMKFAINQPSVTINTSLLPANVYYLKVDDLGKPLPVQKIVISR